MIKKDPFTSLEMQAVDLIQQYIADHGLAEGDQLPSIKQLAELFKTSKNTINAALDYLGHQGLIYVRPRYGTFVSSRVVQGNKRLDWSSIWRKSAYQPTDGRLLNVMSGIGHDDDVLNVSLMNMCDNIYIDVLKNASLRLLETAVSSNMLEVCHFSGLNELKEHLCCFMARYGMKVQPKQIFFTASVFEAVQFISKLLLRSGSTVLYEIPGITNTRSHFQTMGAYTQPIEMDEEGISEESLLRHIKKNRNSFLYTYPVNSIPTGHTTSAGRKMAVQEICLNADVPIIEIDTYRILDFELRAPETYYTYSGGNGVVYIGSLGSIFPFSFSLSWIVMPFHLIEVAQDMNYQQQGPKNNVYIQMLVNEMFKDGSIYSYMTQVKEHLQIRESFSRPIIEKYLGDIAEIEDRHPQVYWVKLPVSSRHLLRYKNELSAVLGPCFSPKHEDYIVISKVNPGMDAYEKGIKRLRDLLDIILAGKRTVQLSGL